MYFAPAELILKFITTSAQTVKGAQQVKKKHTAVARAECFWQGNRQFQPSDVFLLTFFIVISFAFVK